MFSNQISLDKYQYAHIMQSIEFGLRKAINESVEADSSFNFLWIDNKDNTKTIQWTSDCMSNDEYTFFEYCKNTYKPQRYEFTYETIEDPRVFPIIYEIGNDFVTIEYLRHNTIKCNKWINALDEDFHGQTIREWIKTGCMPKTMNKTAALRFRAEVLCWGLRVTNELEKIGYDTSILFEICIDNIAERQNGDIVMILPPTIK